MSLKTTISLPELSRSVIGLVGISSLDNYVYIWQIIEQEESPDNLIIYQVNPLVPRSWRVFKELSLVNIVDCFHASFNATCSKMAFRYRCINVSKDELFLADMTSDQTETRLIQNFVGDVDLFCEFAETAVGWVGLVMKEGRIYCCKMFPDSEENPILLTLAPEPAIFDTYQNMTGLTFDNFMYIELTNGLCKVVSHCLLSGNSVEMGFAQWNTNLEVPYPSLIGTCDKSYLIRPSEDVNQGNNVYQVEQDHLGITLTYSNQLYGQFNVINRNLWKAGNDKMAFIHGQEIKFYDTKFQTVLHMGVPSLKTLAVWAIQKHYGTIGEFGELADGISEEEFKKWIGYPQKAKLF